MEPRQASTMFCAAQLDAGAAVTVVVDAAGDEPGDCAEAGADIEAARTAMARKTEAMVVGRDMCVEIRAGKQRWNAIAKSW